TISKQLRQLEAAFRTPLLRRVGRRVELTEDGQRVFQYAEAIFTIGRELQDAVGRGATGPRPQIVVGVPDVLPKLIAHRLLRPVVCDHPEIRLVCVEARHDDLLTELAVHRLDVVLSDAPASLGVNAPLFSHPLGECGTAFFAEPVLAERLRSGFPESLDGAPMLLPAARTMVRRDLDRWFMTLGLRPRVVAEFEDSALMKVFGQEGAGVFCAPAAIEREIECRYGVRVIGRAGEIVQRFYAITVRRHAQHPAVETICRQSPEFAPKRMGPMVTDAGAAFHSRSEGSRDTQS
ncbi:MAG: LysR family transcriptional regulator, partial [Planctomycetota bacterium]